MGGGGKGWERGGRGWQIGKSLRKGRRGREGVAEVVREWHRVAQSGRGSERVAEDGRWWDRVAAGVWGISAAGHV